MAIVVVGWSSAAALAHTDFGLSTRRVAWGKMLEKLLTSCSAPLLFRLVEWLPVCVCVGGGALGDLVIDELTRGP